MAQDYGTARMRRMSNEYRESALLGTWAKVGRSKYQRATGEIVERDHRGLWAASDGWAYASCSAAMWNVDRKFKGA
jgi:hypothetical protein